MFQKQFYVYIMANDRKPTLYTGITSDLVARVYQHKEKSTDSFTKQYDLEKLVYFEVIEDADAAIQREKRIKKWNRQWKLDLIQKSNPNLDDLYSSMI